MQMVTMTLLVDSDPHGLRAVLASESGVVQVLGTWETDRGNSRRGGKA
jgi:hypothetical protein